MKKFDNKKLLDDEIDIGLDLLLAEKHGKDCYDLFALGTLEEYEHCGDCYW